MSHVSNRPLTEEQYELVESLEQLPLSGTNQGIAKVGSTTLQNVTFSGGGSCTGFTGDLYDSTNTIIATVLNGLIKTVVYPIIPTGNFYIMENGIDYYLMESGVDKYLLE